MHDIGPGVTRLDPGNVYVHRSVRAIAAGTPLPDPPADTAWMERAVQHGMLSIIAEHLQPTTEEGLRAVRVHRAIQHLRAMADLRVIKDVLDDAGIEWLLFKGPVLSEVVYQRPGARISLDLDVLVRPDDIGRAVDHLLARGATPLRGDWKAMQSIGDGECEYLMPHGTQIDLHWDVINEPWARPGFSVSVDELFACSRTVDVGGLVVQTFGPIDTVLHVALHACRSGGDKLRWLLDLHQCLLRCDAPVDEILDRAGTLRLELALRTMVGRLKRFVGDSRLDPLPAASLAQRTWLAADDFVIRRFPPGARYEGRFSGAIMTGSLRGDAISSWGKVVAVMPSTLRGRRHQGLDADRAGVT